MCRLAPHGLLAVTMSLGCGPAPAPPANASSGAPVSVPIAARESSPMATSSSCAEPALPPAPGREKAIDAFLSDRPREALDLLDATLRADPRDRAAEAFRQASAEKLAEAQAQALEAVGRARRISLERLPLVQAQRRAVPAAHGKVQLAKESEAKNLITDFADWEKKNQLEGLGRRRHDDLRGPCPRGSAANASAPRSCTPITSPRSTRRSSSSRATASGPSSSTRAR